MFCFFVTGVQTTSPNSTKVSLDLGITSSKAQAVPSNNVVPG